MSIKHFQLLIYAELLANAGRAGDLSQIKALLSRGADPQIPASCGWSSITFIVRNAHKACFDLLLPLSNLRTKDQAGATALMIAAISGHHEFIPLLLPASLPNERDFYGRTALMHACFAHEDPSCAQALLSSSDLFAKNRWGDNALDLAAQTGSARCIDLLLPHFAHDPDALRHAASAAQDHSRPDTARQISSYFAHRERDDIDSCCPPDPGAATHTLRI